MEELTDYSKYRLEDLVKAFLSIKSLPAIEKVVITGKSGQEHEFDYLISKKKISNEFIKPGIGETGIIIKDYKKPAGSDVVTRTEKMGKDCGFGKVMLCSNSFSASAKALAERSNLLTLSRGKLVSILRQYSVDMEAINLDS